MSERKPIYITDRDDHGRRFGHLIAVCGDGLYRIDLPPHLSVISTDGDRYRGDDALDDVQLTGLGTGIPPEGP